MVSDGDGQHRQPSTPSTIKQSTIKQLTINHRNQK
jgi:hypothetical protein